VQSLSPLRLRGHSVLATLLESAAGGTAGLPSSAFAARPNAVAKSSGGGRAIALTKWPIALAMRQRKGATNGRRPTPRLPPQVAHLQKLASRETPTYQTGMHDISVIED